MADLGSEQGLQQLIGRSKALLLAPLGQDVASGSRASNAQLRGSLERFVTDRYLPDVYVNFRWVNGLVGKRLEICGGYRQEDTSWCMMIFCEWQQMQT